jgi:hypothetical protein
MSMGFGANPDHGLLSKIKKEGSRKRKASYEKEESGDDDEGEETDGGDAESVRTSKRLKAIAPLRKEVHSYLMRYHGAVMNETGRHSWVRKRHD